MMMYCAMFDAQLLEPQLRKYKGTGETGLLYQKPCYN